LQEEMARKFDQALGPKPPARKISEEERLARQAEYAELLHRSAIKRLRR
jgi:hypothetical protein